MMNLFNIHNNMNNWVKIGQKGCKLNYMIQNDHFWIIKANNNSRGRIKDSINTHRRPRI